MRDNIQIYSEIHESDKDVWLIGTHGIGEHLGRHKYLVDLFGEKYNICQYDLRGHGKSSGKKAYVENFSDYMLDLKEVITFLKEKYRMERFVLFGHSMGALITSAYMQSYAEESSYPEKVVLNAPPVGLDGILGEIVKILPIEIVGYLSKIPFSVPLGGLVNLNYLSHDSTIKDLYLRDDLNQMKLHSKLLIELVKASKETYSKPLRSRAQSYVSVGSDDKVVGSQALVDYFTHMDKSFALKVFEGAYHEIHNEIEKYRKPYFEYLKNIL